MVSLKTVSIIPDFIYDAPEQMGDLFVRMWPVDYDSYFSMGVHEALMETLNIATLGTVLALFMALPVGLLAASNITRSGVLNWLAKLILVSSRTVNSLVLGHPVRGRVRTGRPRRDRGHRLPVHRFLRQAAGRGPGGG